LQNTNVTSASNGEPSANAAGLALVAIGTFLAQATATGFVGRAATSDRAAACGLYLACYFLGGLAGSAALGQVYDRLGWRACLAGIALALGVAGVLAAYLRMPGPASATARAASS
jgi:predicted MFS family arabinose efflux permease